MVVTDGSTKYKLDLSEVAQNIIPFLDDTYNLGSQTRRWAYLYVVIAVMTSALIGGIYVGATAEEWFFINASTQINGSLNVTGNATADYFFGNGSQLTDISYTETDPLWSANSSLVVYASWTNITYDSELDNATIIRSWNTSWVTSSETDPLWTGNSTNVVYADWTNITYGGDLDNESIIRVGNLSWRAVNCSAEGVCDLVTYDTELDNSTIIRIGNTSWLIDPIDTRLGNETIIRDFNLSWRSVNCSAEGICELITYNTDLDNKTIIRIGNISWIASGETDPRWSANSSNVIYADWTNLTYDVELDNKT
ncbi:unnamed protein product, partial [marine sediment metagenome]